MAHDLRTPLNSFALGLQALHGMTLDSEMRSVVDMMSVSAELMEITCTKAIDHSKFEAGHDMSAMKAPFDLISVLRKSQIVLSGYTHESKNVSYKYTISKGQTHSMFCLCEGDHSHTRMCVLDKLMGTCLRVCIYLWIRCSHAYIYICLCV